MPTPRNSYANWIIAFLLLATRLDPGIFFWRTVYQSHSPVSRHTLVEVQQRGCIIDCAMRVVLYSGFQAEVLTQQGDCYFGLAQAAWQAERVGVFVNGGYCNSFQTAYDLAASAAIDAHALDPARKAAIFASYGVIPVALAKHLKDALIWAASNDAVWASYVRQPARLSRLLQQRSGISLQ
jgi:hypothetical protein